MVPGTGGHWNQDGARDIDIAGVDTVSGDLVIAYQEVLEVRSGDTIIAMVVAAMYFEASPDSTGGVGGCQFEHRLFAGS